MNRRDFIYAASAGAASAAASPVATFAQNNSAAAPDARQSAVKLRTITLEEHFATPAFAAGPGKGLVERLRSSGPRCIKIAEQLLDVSDGRVAEMDAVDIDVQVLSGGHDMSKRILVVEDQEHNRQIIRDLLSATDYEITEAESGEQALEAVAKQRPDLILMDIQLPGIDGYETTRRI
jgi:hypothetical protein